MAEQVGKVNTSSQVHIKEATIANKTNPENKPKIAEQTIYTQ